MSRTPYFDSYIRMKANQNSHDSSSDFGPVVAYPGLGTSTILCNRDINNNVYHTSPADTYITNVDDSLFGQLYRRCNEGNLRIKYYTVSYAEGGETITLILSGSNL